VGTKYINDVENKGTFVVNRKTTEGCSPQELFQILYYAPVAQPVVLSACDADISPD
jgi:hypothetical protein